MREDQIHRLQARRQDEDDAWDNLSPTDSSNDEALWRAMSTHNAARRNSSSDEKQAAKRRR